MAEPEEEAVATEAEGEPDEVAVTVDVVLDLGENEDEGLAVSKLDAKAVRVADGEGLVELEGKAEKETRAEAVAE